MGTYGPIQAATMDERTVAPCAAHSPLHLAPGTGADSQAEATSDKTKVQQLAKYWDHRKRPRATLVAGEKIFRMYKGNYNIQPTDRTKETQQTIACQTLLRVIPEANGVALDLS